MRLDYAGALFVSIGARSERRQAGREVDRLRRPHLLQCPYDRDPPPQVELL
jgi:hypothetical protein